MNKHHQQLGDWQLEFGMYCGLELREIPIKYLRWILSKHRSIDSADMFMVKQYIESLDYRMKHGNV
jgi:uncharacterized protein (DUF3820 family)